MMARVAASVDEGSCMECEIPDPTRSMDVVVFRVGSFKLRLCGLHAKTLIEAMGHSVKEIERRDRFR